jgi:hypothetical protein
MDDDLLAELGANENSIRRVADGERIGIPQRPRFPAG